ncbi:pseudouridine synthase, partial [Xylogone sp. PMI_703]
MLPSYIWRMTNGKILEGVFAINKPCGLSSAQVVRDLQHHFNPSKAFEPWIQAEKRARDRESHNQRKRRREKKIQVKIGHGGTLDPLATGVLIMGVGRGTKELHDFLLCTKEYEAVVLFGTETDTYDRVGKILKRAPYQHITKALVEDALSKFRGKFMQLPPLFSALKMNGKPLYEYAREGKEIPREIERRPVEVLELEIVEWMEPGTHSHKAPTEEAGYAEVNVAEKLWNQEDERTEPVKAEHEKLAQENSESKKRKLGEGQDDLVIEQPISKQRRSSSSGQEPIMSGGLAPTDGSDSTGLIPEHKEESQKAQPDSTDLGPPAAKIRMTVTSGFYVRSLCHDLGAALGSAALMAELTRTRQGQFELGSCFEYKDLTGGEEIWAPKIEAMLDEWASSRGNGKATIKESSDDKEGSSKADLQQSRADGPGESPASKEDVL